MLWETRYKNYGSTEENWKKMFMAPSPYNKWNKMIRSDVAQCTMYVEGTHFGEKAEKN